MTVSGVTTWHEANQRHLALALQRVRSALEAHDARRRGETPRPLSLAEGGPAGQAPMALDALVSGFGLSSFERDLLVLCAGVELDSALAALCAAAQGDPLRAYPTLSLALAALPDAHWSALTPGAPLRRWRMIEVGAGPALTVSPLRIDERVLHYLTGVDGIDERLTGLVFPVRESPPLAGSQRTVADRIVGLWSRASERGPLPVIQLSGEAVTDARGVAAAVCASLGLRLFVLPCEALPAAPHELETLCRLWRREAALGGSVLLLEGEELEHGEASRLRRFVDQAGCALFVCGRERRRLGHQTVVSLEIARPTAPEQHAAWRAALGTSAEALNGEVDLLVAQFNLSTQAIRSAAVDAMTGAGNGPPAELGRAIWDACRVQSRPRLEDLAQRIESDARWEDLVLPEAQREILRDVAVHVRNRLTVYDRWGFGRPGARGLGISALFAGASGTGKTMAAEVLAGDLRLDLYRIDLSSVVSKYIGETEKNLRRIFDAAEEGGAVLLFDEADALFGKRSEVKDSHDRYANIEVSYLLQRMECYRGLAILTTNMRAALDQAFLRRIRFVVQFPFPDAAQRAEIWRRIFPPATPVEGLDSETLARLNVAGGNIRNIAMHAAFMAADSGEPVRMQHLLRAARTEYAKLEKVLTEAEVEGWA